MHMFMSDKKNVESISCSIDGTFQYRAVVLSHRTCSCHGILHLARCQFAVNSNPSLLEETFPA